MHLFGWFIWTVWWCTDFQTLNFHNIFFTPLGGTWSDMNAFFRRIWILTDSQSPVPFWLHCKLLILCPSWKPEVPFQCLRRLTTGSRWVSVLTALSVVTVSNVERFVKIFIIQINKCRSGVWVSHVTLQFGYFCSAI